MNTLLNRIEDTTLLKSGALSITLNGFLQPVRNLGDVHKALFEEGMVLDEIPGGTSAEQSLARMFRHGHSVRRRLVSMGLDDGVVEVGGRVFRRSRDGGRVIVFAAGRSVLVRARRCSIRGGP